MSVCSGRSGTRPNVSQLYSNTIPFVISIITERYLSRHHTDSIENNTTVAITTVNLFAILIQQRTSENVMDHERHRFYK